MFQAMKKFISNPNYKSIYQFQFKRSIKNNVDKKYDGYWTLILRQHALSPTEQNESQNKSSIASISIDSDNKEEIPTFKEETLIYTVDGELIPPKPAFPDNCSQNQTDILVTTSEENKLESTPASDPNPNEILMKIYRKNIPVIDLLTGDIVTDLEEALLWVSNSSGAGPKTLEY
ncbi:7038_t:CDS:2 [Diversispora eburnea]|uniref:7038_t:CDS:1 n=1 Tax=Diversispora eburnea TaxID=1213867 RepID=A0A9N9FRS9_9GLOM|nr:7038_t:CDS:2 [Diversispora eburnea]